MNKVNEDETILDKIGCADELSEDIIRTNCVSWSDVELHVICN